MRAIHWLLAICISTLSGATSAQQIYKSVDEKGNVIYSEQPYPGAQEAQPVEIDAGPSKAQQEEAAQRQRSLEQAVQQAGDERTTQQRTARERLEKAEAEFDAAKRSLEQAKQIGPGDRQGTAGGGSRLTDSYRQRVEGAEAELAAARQRLEEAQAGK